MKQMTNNEKFYTEQIINYLNLLADDEMFKQEWSPCLDENYWEVTISCKNTAYIGELHLLEQLLNLMKPMYSDSPTEVKLR